MPRALAVFVVSATGLAAQGPARAPGVSGLVTAQSYGNFAVEGAALDARGLRPGHALPLGFTGVAAATANTAAETVLGWEESPGGVVAASVSEQATGWALRGAMELGTMASAAGRSAEGPHDLRMRVAGAAGARGKVEVWAMGFATSGARTSIAVDVGADGTEDYAYVAAAAVVFDRRQWNVRLGALGLLDVVIRTEGRAAVPAGGRATYFSGVTVRFTPGAFCDVAAYGAACGPRLTGYDAAAGGARRLEVELAGAPASSPGFLVVGSSSVALPLPGGCTLLAEPALVLPFPSDARGDAVHALALPPADVALSLRLQAIAATSRLFASNGLAVTCRP
jgi:hypothetical protein